MRLFNRLDFDSKIHYNRLRNKCAPILLPASEWKTIDKSVGADKCENDGVIERLRGTLRHKKANAWNKWIAMTLMMTTNNCNFQSANGFARLNSSKNLKLYDYTFYGHRFGFFPRLPSRIVISWFLFSCAHIRAYHLRLLIDVYSFILIWLRGKQGKQLVHIIFVSLSFVNSLSSRSA